INVGLFAVPTNAHNAVRKLTGAGLTAYTQEIKSKTKGKLTAVRVGPFENRLDADTAAERIRALELEAVVFQR
ncbi:SPOR domain-containing protein, partial [Rhodoferax saidenbachensis]